MTCCKKIIISEEEKQEILSKYGIILEQVPQQNNQQDTEKKSISKDVSGVNYFASGYYSKLDDKGLNQLKIQLEDVVKFLELHNGKFSNIKIIASEDSEPNWDREKDPSGKGKYDAKGNFLSYKLPDKELARLRAETIKTFLTNYFKELVSAKKIANMPTFEEFELRKGTSNDAAQKQKDRMVLIRFTVIGNDFDCLNGLTINVLYDPTKMDKHVCNSAVYEVMINGIPLKRVDGMPYASLNNNGILENPTTTGKYVASDNKKGGARNNYFIVNAEVAKQLLETNPTSFQISLTCKNSDSFGGPTVNDIDPTTGKGRGRDCHADVGMMYFKSSKSPTVQIAKAMPPRKENETTVFATINACGYIIK